MKIIKTVIPAAGWGTRFLPFTKSVPKEMLPLLNKPAIQVIVEEIIASKMQNCIMITAPHKQALANFFDEMPELNLFLKQKNKENLISDVQKISKALEFTYIHQEEAKGLGHAIWLARHAIANEYFGVVLPDDIMVSQPPALAQLMDICYAQNATVLAVQEMPKEAVSAYGVVAIKKQLSSDLFEVSGLVEKPKPEDAPSNLAILGRYILSHKIFKALDDIKPTIGGEIQLTDGIANMLHAGERVLAYKVQGTRHDIGTPAGWLKANIEFAASNPAYTLSK